MHSKNKKKRQRFFAVSEMDLTTPPFDRQLESARNILPSLSHSNSTLCVIGKGFALLAAIATSFLYG